MLSAAAVASMCCSGSGAAVVTTSRLSSLLRPGWSSSRESAGTRTDAETSSTKLTTSTRAASADRGSGPLTRRSPSDLPRCTRRSRLSIVCVLPVADEETSAGDRNRAERGIDAINRIVGGDAVVIGLRCVEIDRNVRAGAGSTAQKFPQDRSSVLGLDFDQLH